jgi:succinate dehydrogenase / fumarate reductase, iron-sulfur subunit
MTTQAFKIFRYNPSTDKQPYFRTYEIAVKPSWTVIDCLNEIRSHHDSTLAFRRSCRGGICGSCAMNINRKNLLACETMVATLGKKAITIRPLPHFEIIRDLVVDLTCFFRAIERIRPFAHGDKKPDQEIVQTPAERKKLDGLYECILCGACTSACPSFWYNDRYPGPAALLKTFRFVADSRDQASGERLQAADTGDGAWQCHTIFNCVEACPKGLNPTKAIQQLKRRIFSYTWRSSKKKAHEHT